MADFPCGFNSLLYIFIHTHRVSQLDNVDLISTLLDDDMQMVSQLDDVDSIYTSLDHFHRLKKRVICDEFQSVSEWHHTYGPIS